MNYDMYLSAAARLAKEAGEFLKRFREEGSLKIEEKGCDLDFVTNADKTSQKMIFEGIKELFPSHRFIGEEDGLTDTEIASRLRDNPDDFFWVVDPLDGTLNYIRGIGNYSVSIGLVKGGKSVVCAICCPSEGELFTASRGGGAFLNGRPIASSKCVSLHNALVIQSIPTTDMELRKKMIAINDRMSMKTLNTRMIGSAAREIAQVATGGADAYFEYGIHPWDVAAGIVLAAEAGAAVTAIDGGEYELWNPGIIVAAQGIYADLLKAIDYK